MEFTITPPHLQDFQHFTEAAVTGACKRFLLDCVLDSKPSLVSALAGAFSLPEDDL